MSTPVSIEARSIAGARHRDAERPIGSKCQETCVRPTPAQAHCSVCHQTFGSVGGFDRHRRDGRCLDPAELGMVERGGVWRTPMDPEAAEKLRAGREPAEVTE